MKKILFIILFFLFFETLLEAKNVNYAPEVYIIFRNDDISALSNSEHERKILALFEKYNFPQTVGVIPQVAEDVHDAFSDKYSSILTNQPIIDLLKEYKNKGLVRIAQHGFTHQTNRYYLKDGRMGYSEFKKLTYEQQENKILQGKNLLKQIFGDNIKIFIPPWNIYDEITLEILEKNNFEIISADWSRPFVKNIDLELTNISATLESIDSLKIIKILEKSKEFPPTSGPIILVILYHSRYINTPNDFNELEKILKYIDQNKFIVTNFEDINRNYNLKYKEELSGSANGLKLKDALKSPEKDLILKALEEVDGNRNEAAKILGINRTTLYKKMQNFGLLKRKSLS